MTELLGEDFHEGDVQESSRHQARKNRLNSQHSRAFLLGDYGADERSDGWRQREGGGEYEGSDEWDAPEHFGAHPEPERALVEGQA